MQSAFPVDQISTATTLRPISSHPYPAGSPLNSNISEIMIGLQSCRVFQGIVPHNIIALAESCSTRSFLRGELVFREGDHPEHCVLILKGRIKKYHETPEGKHSILGFVDSNQLMGVSEAIQGRSRNENAEAIEKTTAIVIPRQAILHLMQEHPDVCRRLLEMMCVRVQASENRIKSMLFRSSRDRLIALLDELSIRYGKQTPDGILIAQKFSHQDLANLIGATRETVTITLGELQNEGIVSIERRRITVKSPLVVEDA